ncbi:MAG: hypothetical protein BAJALOKI2v1_40099 [Promethearchaeota archaeon]|nr:MAG: hypothetical protein BAJALOKI2v1_40099 [Candidatus Lokiarchaeota archaeon]
MTFRKTRRDSCGIFILAVILIQDIIALIQMMMSGETLYAILLFIGALVLGILLLYTYKKTGDPYPTQNRTPDKKVDEITGRA